MAIRQAASYKDQLRQLMPVGPAWAKEFYSLPEIAIGAFAEELGRVDARAEALLFEMFPGSIRELLADWERVMGLPDACLGSSSTTGERVADVVRRFSEVGRQDAAYFEELAHRMGYPNAWVEQWRAPRFGHARFGRARFGTWDTQFVWTLHLGQRLPGGRRFGLARFRERFGGNPADIIECIVRRYAPAHTQVIFDYS